MQRYARIVGSLAILSVLAGCVARVGEPPPDSQRRKLLVRLAVTLATDRLLTTHPRLAPVIKEVALLGQSLFATDTVVKLTDISGILRAHMPWDKIPVEHRPMVELLLDMVSEEIRLLLVSHELEDPNMQLLIREVLTWIGDVAERHLVYPARGVRP